MLQEDFKSDFFSNSFLDTTETFDSIGFRKINIQPMLRLGGMHENKSSTSFDIGIHEEMNNKSVLNNSYGMGRLNFHVNDNPISLSRNIIIKMYGKETMILTVRSIGNLKKKLATQLNIFQICLLM